MELLILATLARNPPTVYSLILLRVKDAKLRAKMVKINQCVVKMHLYGLWQTLHVQCTEIPVAKLC